MYSVDSIFQTQTEAKRSKFISFLVPYHQFKTLYNEAKEQHPKANHIVYAYRYLNEHNQIVENSSDDGEPKGAAGTPTLNHLRGANLIEAALFTVRYFGGIKLGVGGMVRAYSSAAGAVIEHAELLPYEALEEFYYEAPYPMQRQIEYHLKSCQIDTIEREFGSESVKWHIIAPESKLRKLKQLLV